uniref:Uncharacterized protein n=1 Tax=Leptobrachium leishanense TaxID=445787 RepID=A0A8C5PD93_9ANUR
MERGKDSNAPDGCSRELLGVGATPGGLYEKLLISKKQSGQSGAAPPIVRMPRSSILDRVQSFLPELAQANENLSKEIESSPAGTFDIENTEEEEKIIEMDSRDGLLYGASQELTPLENETPKYLL